jgi:hypothetical protein
MHEKKRQTSSEIFLVPYKSRQMKRFVSNAEYDEEVEEICEKREFIFIFLDQFWVVEVVVLSEFIEVVKMVMFEF